MFFNSKRKYGQWSDEQILLGYKARPENVFIGILYERYAHLVLGTCLKYLQNQQDAEDLVMHIFEKLPGRILKHEIKFFKSWLYILTKNECFMQLRSAKKFMSTDLNDNLSAQESEEEDILGVENSLEKLEESLKDLKDEQEKCIRMFYFEHKSYDEIAIDLNLSVKQVKSAIQNGRRNLKTKLEKNHDNEE